MKLFIKICGITSRKDAEAAVSAGADAIGLNMWPRSRRHVDRERAREIVQVLPAGILKVGVFVDETPAVVAETLDALGLDCAQLHGNENPEDFRSLGRERIIRAVRVRDEASLHLSLAWPARLMVYDAFVDGYGGGGVLAPWDLIARGARRPFLLAGGLTPDNVAHAIRATHPDGLDVASGVESSPGVKDHDRLRAFIRAARQTLQP